MKKLTEENVLNSGTRRPTASQLMQNAARFNCGSFRNFEKNRGVVLEMLDKAEAQVAHEENMEKKAAERRSRNLFVKNLPFTVSSEQLREAFRPLGRVQSAKVMMTPARESKGFGFVCFGTRAEAEAAQRKMDGKWMFGRQLYVSFAQTRAERTMELNRRYGKQEMEKTVAMPTGKAPEPEQKEFVEKRGVGEKPPSWGKSLSESEAEEKNVRIRETQGLEDPIAWDPTPADMMLLEELVLPPGLADVSDLEKSSITPRKKGRDPKRMKRGETETGEKEDWMQKDDTRGFVSSLDGLIIPPHMLGTTKADRRHNVSSPKKRAVREGENELAREGTRKKRKLVDWSTTLTLKKSLKKLNIEELCQVIKDMTAGMELMVDMLGMGWTLIMDGVRKIDEEEKINKSPDEKMEIDERGIEDPLEGIVGEKRGSSWETLPRNVLETIEKYLSPAEKTRFRTCSRQVMGNWWFWPRDRCAYIRWGIDAQREHNNYVGGIIREVREREETYKAEKEKKREEKEAAQEARVPAAAAEYLRDHGKVPGVGYRSIARKYRITQQQLKDEVERLEEERIAALYPSDDDDYP